MKERLRRRTTFDSVAAVYDRVRPGYPDDLFDDLVELTGSKQGSILEIGCGTGQATRSLAQRGFDITCVEMGKSLAEFAKRNFAAHPNVRVEVGDFETLDLEDAAFDLVFSATAFHWLDPDIRYQKAARLLTKTGFLAPCWNVHLWAEESGGFFEEVQEVYLEVAPEMAARYPGLPKTPADIDHLELKAIPATGLFREPELRTYRWTETYSAARYLELLSTYSDHRRLEPSVRTRLLEGTANLIDTHYGGQIVKGYLSVLYVAQRA